MPRSRASIQTIAMTRHAARRRVGQPARRFVVWCAAVLLVLPTLLAPASTALAAASVTGIYLDGEPNEWVSAGNQWILTPPDHTITSSEASPDHSHANFYVDGGNWSLSFQAPTGQSLAAGATYPATNGAVSATLGGIYVAGDGRGCTLAAAEFTVLEIAYDHADQVATFAANFWQRCDDNRNAVLYGSIRWHSGFGLKAVSVAPDIIAFGDTTVGVPSTPINITIANGGSEVVQFSDPEFVGPDAAAFEIVGTPCAVVMPGASCIVSVRVNTSSRGVKYADLVIDDSTLRGQRRIPLSTGAYIATTTTIVVTDLNPEDALGPTVTVTVTPNPGAGLVFIDWTGGGGEGDPGHTGGFLDPTTGAYENVPLGMAPGTWTITASFGRHDFYDSSSATLVNQFVAVSTSTTMQSDYSETPPGWSTHLTARVHTAWNAPLPSGTLTIRDSDDAIIATRAVGGSTVDLEATICCLALGTHQFTAWYQPDTTAAFASHGAFNQVIAIPPVPSGSVVIEAGASSTSSPVVALSLSASVLSGTVTQTQLSSDGLHWHWNNFSGTSGWDVTDETYGGSPNDGIHTVFARFATNDSAWSAIASDTILLDRTAPVGTIAAGSALTASTSVTLTLPAADEATGVSQIGLSNDGSTWTIRPYGSIQGWTLMPGDGTKIVRVKWKDGAGNWSVPLSRTFVLDTVGPSGTITIAGGTATTPSTAVTISMAASDPSGVTQTQLSNDGSIWTAGPYATTQAWSLSPGEGAKTVWVRWQDGAGNWSAPISDTIAVVTSVPDTVAPVATAPTKTLVVGSSLTSGKPTVRFAWSGSDVGSGIGHYEFALSTDGGAYSTLSSALANPTLNWALAPGHTYSAAVRATDVAGNVGAWAYGSAFRLTAYQESSSAVHWSGTWRTGSSTSFWGGHDRYASAAGAKASLTFTGRSFAWLGSIGPSRGWAKVYVNGVFVKSVNLNATANANRRILFTTTWSTARSRTITIRISGTAGHPRGDVDAFIVGS